MHKFAVETFIRFPSLANASLARLVFLWADTPADARQAALVYVQNDVSAESFEVTAGKAINLGASAQ